MTLLREDQFEGFLARDLPKFNGILIYGDDPSAAEDYASRLSAKIAAGSGDQPLRLEASSLTSDSGRLVDAFRAMSLLGDRRAITVSGVGETALKSLLLVLQSEALGNFVILLSSSLTKTSKLRVAVEGARRFAVLPLYEAKQADLEKRVDQILARDSLRFEGQARERFFALVGSDRMSVTQEAEKLALYAMGNSTISEADVNAACGDTASMSVSELIDQVLLGNAASIEQMAGSTDDDATGLKAVIPLLSYHLAQLQVLQGERAAGKSIDAAIASARPMIHFSRRRAIASQAQQLDAPMIEKFQLGLEATTLATRRTPELATAMIGRYLMAMAREIRALKR